MATEQTILAEDTDTDSSGYGTGSEYSTASLTSSIYDYRYENGRRYHAYKDGKYILPNDETEQDRLDIVHHIYSLCLDGKLHLAPIGPNPQNILDVGTGTGIWAIDIAEMYPSAKVVGTDLSPIQPSWIPPNVEFQIDDAEAPWTFAKDSFDLVHMRHLAGGITNWDHLLNEAYIHCKPGGWVECAEYEMALTSDDGTVNDKLALWQFYDLVDRAALQTGRSFRVASTLKSILETAGFCNVVHRPIKIPLGTWPADKKQKELGAYVLLSAQSGFEAFGLKMFTGVWKMSMEEATAFLAEVLAGARNKRVHGYSLHHFYYGQKPV